MSAEQTKETKKELFNKNIRSIESLSTPLSLHESIPLSDNPSFISSLANTVPNPSHQFTHVSDKNASLYFCNMFSFFSSEKPIQSVEEKIFNGELKDILRTKLEDLNEQQLMVLQLYYVEELNVYEIGEILSVSTGRVSQIKSAAIKKLKSLIESEVNA